MQPSPALTQWALCQGSITQWALDLGDGSPRSSAHCGIKKALIPLYDIVWSKVKYEFEIRSNFIESMLVKVRCPQKNSENS